MVGETKREQRRQIGRRSHNLYAWLKRHNYPAGYQVLCLSHHALKSSREQQALAA